MATHASHHSQRIADLGRHIFVYNNIRTNQVIYSLSRALNNNASLRQLPFLGKKTVPGALRKDLWTPLATLSFPTPSLGLSALHKLREYRKLHEFSAPDSVIANPKKPGQLLPKKERGKKLMDQKANSIADMAAVLQAQEAEVKTLLKGKEELNTGAAMVGSKVGAQRCSPPIPKRGPVKKRAQIEKRIEELVKVKGQPVRIKWANILDAEFAESWPQGVVHDGLEPSRHTAPPPEPVVRAQVMV